MFNNKVLGFIPFIDSDGVQHTMEVAVHVDIDKGEFVFTAAYDGELITGLEMTESSGVYTIAAGS